MTDSLTRLVLRAQGRLPVASPRLASRYAEAAADAAWGEHINETVAAPHIAGVRTSPASQTVAPASRSLTSERTREPSHPQARHGASRPIVQTSAERRLSVASTHIQPQSEHSSVRAAVPLGDAFPAVARVPAERPPVSPTPMSVQPVMASLDPLPMVVTPIDAALAEMAPPEIAQRGENAAPVGPVSEFRPRQTSAGRETAERQLPDITPSQGAAAPEVRISIGRVEVHAVPPPAMPVSPRPTRARRPTISLADYLADKGRAR